MILDLHSWCVLRANNILRPLYLKILDKKDKFKQKNLYLQKWNAKYCYLTNIWMYNQKYLSNILGNQDVAPYFEACFYTERQKKLITSSECHSLKSKTSTWIIFGHRLGKFILHKHI